MLERTATASAIFTSLSVLVILTMVRSASGTNICSISPEGFNEISSQQVLETKFTLQLPFMFVPLTVPITESIVTNYETPLQNRLSVYHAMTNYNAMSVYDTIALDVFGRGDRRLCIDEFATLEELKAHQEMTSPTPSLIVPFACFLNWWSRSPI